MLAVGKKFNCFSITTPAICALLKQGTSNVPTEMSKDRREVVGREILGITGDREVKQIRRKSVKSEGGLIKESFLTDRFRERCKIAGVNNRREFDKCSRFN